jgi:uncharacterized protein HemX
MDPYQQMNPAPVSPEVETPRPGGGSGWIAWVVGIFLVIIVGGGLYYYYQYIKIPELNDKAQSLEDQVNSLQQQIEQNQSSSTGASVPEGNTQPTQ